MSENNVKSMIGKVFSDIAEGIETGQFGKKIRVGVTTLGSELGTENVVKGAELAQKRDSSLEVVLIGPKVDSFLTQEIVSNEDEGYKKMEELLDSGELDSCVTMHYNFPIGVSTVGRVVTPGKGKEMFIATTTGTSAINRVEAMIRNGIHGIITAKSMGIKRPTLGILNVDGARQVEKAFKELVEKGYDINFVESSRSDGGYVMRGNDLLLGTPDVMITDTLTGNILMKVFSSFTTGGSFESQGFGYGPGIGEKQDRTVLIISRASGSPVIANAINYGADLSRGGLKDIYKDEFKKVQKAGLKDIIGKLTKDAAPKAQEEEVKAPPKETVTGTISGIDIMELEDAVSVLWKNGIYAESGMGCTGPIVMVNEAKLSDALKALSNGGYAVDDSDPC
ncbi:glycine/sarcosine/betaine reductase complex component C subunit alpha [Tissierella creatinophila]|uniref:Glycine/sarcosine/betaine reductase complex component C subunit alpha n=1 Tax=Tissierella creatinophila DSM 6911 TaxID=1123403 RepID=A0A1U7M9H2_TISCR|nr:glycine/sarcosine/betaine reductase complex component C subunit alpha [Tissierella creatinophila]OLS03848.1 glycine/sarcosine/betaine reductase complex component C subunit alpha [Tissierella creatinophila DSM 6911]